MQSSFNQSLESQYLCCTHNVRCITQGDKVQSFFFALFFWLQSFCLTYFFFFSRQTLIKLFFLSSSFYRIFFLFICGSDDFRCKSFQTTKRDECCRIPGSTILPTASGHPMQIRLPHINAAVFRQFILYAYTGKVLAIHISVTNVE